MNRIEKYQKYMRFKSHFKNIPFVSASIRYIKWKYYRPIMMKRFRNSRLADYSKKLNGSLPWLENEKYFLALKDSHKGETAFIIGNGPSLKPSDLDKLYKNNIFCFGMNKILYMFDKTKWRPNCYMVIDNMMFREGNSTVLKILDEPIDYFMFAEEAYDGIPKDRLANNILLFHSMPNSYYVPISEFSDNAALYMVDGFTVTYTAMQMAYYMGFKKVYLLGVDFNYERVMSRDGKVSVGNDNTTYFDKRYDPNNLNYGFMIGQLEAYETAKKFCETHDFKIYNATRGGKLNVFERVDFDQLLDTLLQ